MPPGKRSILIVGGSKDSSRILPGFLAQAGYEVITAGTGEEALGKLKEINYSLLITDMRMDGMGGIELLKEAKQVKPNIEVIIVTAHGEVNSYLKAMNLGAFEYINKPLKMDELERVVSKALEKDNALKLNAFPTGAGLQDS